MNKHVPHVLVLPEDDANRQLATGFTLDHSLDTRRMQVLEEAGGWEPVLERFKRDHVHDMERYPNCFVVLLIDFDEHRDRFDVAMASIPGHLRDRVFVLGVWSFPERLRVDRGEGYEAIGRALARDCRENTSGGWSHPLLSHNAAEVERLQRVIRPILFPSR